MMVLRVSVEKVVWVTSIRAKGAEAERTKPRRGANVSLHFCNFLPNSTLQTTEYWQTFI